MSTLRVLKDDIQSMKNDIRQMRKRIDNKREGVEGMNSIPKAVYEEIEELLSLYDVSLMCHVALEL